MYYQNVITNFILVFAKNKENALVGECDSSINNSKRLCIMCFPNLISRYIPINSQIGFKILKSCFKIYLKRNWINE